MEKGREKERREERKKGADKGRRRERVKGRGNLLYEDDGIDVPGSDDPI